MSLILELRGAWEGVAGGGTRAVRKCNQTELLSTCFYVPILLNLYKLRNDDPGGRAVYSVVLRLLACWDCGFESRRGHGCLFVVNVVCCQVEISATGRSFIQRSTTVCVCVFNCINNPPHQCFSTFVRPRPSKFFFYKTRARNLLVNTLPFF